MVLFRRILVGVLVVGLALAGYAGYRLFTTEPDEDAPEQERASVTGAAEDGWQRLSYGELRLEVPPGWSRLDMTECESAIEHWGAPDTDPCADDLGLWFFASAVFDPATGPGVHRVDPSDSLPTGGWAGYVTRGDTVVDVADLDEAVVRRVLQSVVEPVDA
jgi:hypothetical protein